jgi:hypothetical protein
MLWQLHENMWRLCLEFWWQKNWLLHHNNAYTFFFHQGIFDCHHSHTPNFAWLGLLQVSPVYLIEDTAIWHNWGDQVRIASGAKHPYRTRLPGCI